MNDLGNYPGFLSKKIKERERKYKRELRIITSRRRWEGREEMNNEDCQPKENTVMFFLLLSLFWKRGKRERKTKHSRIDV